MTGCSTVSSRQTELLRLRREYLLRLKDAEQVLWGG